MASCDAERYERGMKWLKMDRLRAKAWQTVSGDVLEIGMGTGLNRPYYPAEARVFAFDISAERVAWAKANRPLTPERLATADAQQLPYPAERFDTVVTTLTFCSIPNPRQALGEIKRVLKPSGRLIMVEHVRGQKRWSAALTDLLQPLWFALQGECNLNRETAEIVTQVGFEMQELKTYGLFAIVQYIEAIKAKTD